MDCMGDEKNPQGKLVKVRKVYGTKMTSRLGRCVSPQLQNTPPLIHSEELSIDVMYDCLKALKDESLLCFRISLIHSFNQILVQHILVVSLLLENYIMDDVYFLILIVHHLNQTFNHFFWRANHEIIDAKCLMERT